MNVDSLRTNEAIYTLECTLNTNNIDIACIQETHNERIGTQIIKKTTIFYGGCIVNMAKIKNKKRK